MQASNQRSLRYAGSGSGKVKSLPVDRAAAPYSLPGSKKEDGPAVLRRKQALQTTLAVVEEPRQVGLVWCGIRLTVNF